MTRNLNSRQEQFATSVAAGNPLVAAYRELYQPPTITLPRCTKMPSVRPGIPESPPELKSCNSHGCRTCAHCSAADRTGGWRMSKARRGEQGAPTM
jgi:hypothetical protein